MTTQIKAGVIAANAVNSSELASGALSGQTFTGDVIFSGTTQGTRLGLGNAPHATAPLHITTTNQHIRLNNGSELGAISVLSTGELDIWGHGDGETINFRTGTGSGTVAMNVVGTNVGIGTSNPTQKLDVNGNIAVGYDSSSTHQILKDYATNHASANRGGILQLGIYDGSFAGIKVVNAASSVTNYNSQYISFETHEGAVSVAERMRITSTGNVGIGTASPSYPLEVQSGGVGTVLRAGTSFVSIDSTGSASAPSLIFNGDANTGIWRPASDTLAVSTAGSERMRIDSSGTVLFKSGSFPTNQDSPFIYRIGGGSLAIGAATETGTTAHAAFYTNSLERMRIDYSGNVGIGTNSILGISANATTLDIRGGVTTKGGAIRLRSSDSSVSTYLYADNTSGLSINTSTSHPMVFRTAGSERMRIDGSGNLFLNTTSAMDACFVQFTDHSNGEAFLGLSSKDDNNVGIRFGVGTTRKWVNYRDTSNNLIWYDNAAAAERMRIDSSGNLLVGTSTLTPNYTGGIRVHSASSVGNIRVSAGAKTGFDMMADSGGTGYLVVRDNAGMTFHTNNTERMRIDSSGKLLIGTTSASDAQIISRTSGSSYNMYYQAPSLYAGDYRFIRFQAGSPLSTVGSISSNGSTTTYSTSSDYRLKENVDYEFNALERVAQLKPARFNFIADADTTVDGFLAHEVQDIVPEAISGEKDAVDSEGNPEYQGIDHSKLVPLLTKAIQEQQTIIDDLKSRIETLEG